MKRTISLLLALLFALSLLPMGALAANSAKATTLRLSSSTGTVSVTNASGKKVSVSKGMRLYSGYTTATGKGSNAYITLDSAKAAKLDASSKAGIRQSGNKLELYLASGKLFFNVKQPLASNASMNIRTSTMVAGIRGTMGWVTPTEICILEGQVTLTCINPRTGETRTTIVKAGERVYYEYQTTQSGQPDLLQIDFVKQQAENRHVPAFVVEEIVKDPDVQARAIEGAQGTLLDIPALIADYENKVAREAAEIDAREADIEKRLEEQADEIAKSPVEYYFKDTTSGGGGGGGGGTPATYTVTFPAMTDRTGYTITVTATTATTTTDGGVTYTVPTGDPLMYSVGANPGYYTDAALLDVRENGTATGIGPGENKIVNTAANVTVAGVYLNPTTFAELQAALAGTEDTIYVNTNISGAGNLVVNGNKTLILDGVDVSTTGNLSFVDGSDLEIRKGTNGGTLTVAGTTIACTLTIGDGITLNGGVVQLTEGDSRLVIQKGGTLTGGNMTISAANATIENAGSVTASIMESSGIIKNGIASGTINHDASFSSGNGLTSHATGQLYNIGNMSLLVINAEAGSNIVNGSCDGNQNDAAQLLVKQSISNNGTIAGALSFEVKFHTGEGSGVDPQVVQSGEKVQEPDTPIYNEHTFAGWYDSSLSTKWNFETDIVTGPLTLYAKWVTP